VQGNRARILANCANMSKRKESLSPLEGFFLKDSSKQISFCFSLSLSTGPGQVQRFSTSLVGVLYLVSGRIVTSIVYQNVCPPAAR